MNNTLESHRFFPIIAWTLVFCFAGFTYLLATELRTNMDHLGNRVENLEKRIESEGSR